MAIQSEREKMEEFEAIQKRVFQLVHENSDDFTCTEYPCQGILKAYMQIAKSEKANEGTNKGTKKDDEAIHSSEKLG